MTPADPAAYARGARDVIALARQAADRLEATTVRPLAVGFAVVALRALADEAEALLRPDTRLDRHRHHAADGGAI